MSNSRLMDLSRGGRAGPTDTHGEHYDALPRYRSLTKEELREQFLDDAHELFRWLLNTYAFERSTVTRIRALLPGRK